MKVVASCLAACAVLALAAPATAHDEPVIFCREAATGGPALSGVPAPRLVCAATIAAGPYTSIVRWGHDAVATFVVEIDPPEDAFYRLSCSLRAGLVDGCSVESTGVAFGGSTDPILGTSTVGAALPEGTGVRFLIGPAPLDGGTCDAECPWAGNGRLSLEVYDHAEAV